MWHSGEGMGWWMLMGSVWFVFFWAAVIYVFAHLTNRGTGGGSASETPLDILKRRYATGELTPEDFERMRRELS